MTVHRSLCRVCTNCCPIVVEVDGGRVTRVSGDPDNPVYRGYSCVKGRAQPEFLSHPDRLLTSSKREPDGRLVPIAVEQAMDEIAARLVEIRDRFGPRSIAGYAGTMQIATMTTSVPLYTALMDAIGTPMRFDPNTIDKGGKQVAASLLGRWAAPGQGFDRPDVALLIGINPLVTYTGLPAGNPGKWLGDRLRAGMQLIVIDPRRSDIARRATIHLQPRPGHDAEILAAMIKVILDEGLADDEFVAEHVTGVDRLRRALVPFTPGEVAARADLDPGLLVDAARTYARAARGYTMAGTGPSMSAHGTLVEYLVLTLETVCGRWLRAGEVARAVATLLPTPTCRAQAIPPAPHWRLGDPLRVRGLTPTAAGMPTATLAEEILQPGDGQVRALLTWSGNPVAAFPDQARTIAALESLELLVHLDPWPSATAQLADYVIAPRMPLEAPGLTTCLDGGPTRATGYGTDFSYAHYTPAIVEPPAGSDLIEEWEFFYGLARRIGHEVRIERPGRETIILDTKPTTDTLIGLLTAGSRVPLSEIKQHPGGARFPDPVVTVQPREAGWTGRLDVGNTDILADLDQIAEHGIAGDDDDPNYRFRLVNRRHTHLFNSSCNIEQTNKGRPYNPAYLHPDDLTELDVEPGDQIELRSSIATIAAIAQPDPGLRRGLVSMMFGYAGSNPTRLIPTDRVHDRYIGQPRMSNLPVDVRAVRPGTEGNPGPR